MSTDRIEKTVTLRAPLDRVWAAISDSKQFGTWFGCALEGPFVAGKSIKGTIQMTQVDIEIGRKQAPYVGHPMEWFVEAVEPKRRFAFRWHPFGLDKTVDYSKEPTTLVELVLSEAPGGTKLVITESGFDKLPPERRTISFAANSEGWTKQTELLATYLARQQ